MERRREAAYGDLKGLLTTVQATQGKPSARDVNLVTALRRTSVRARWGELTLRQVVELAGMVEHCDFDQQPAVGERERPMRPDMTIRMPGGLIVPVDSKAPLDAYLDALQADLGRAAERAPAALCRPCPRARGQTGGEGVRRTVRVGAGVHGPVYSRRGLLQRHRRSRSGPDRICGREPDLDCHAGDLGGSAQGRGLWVEAGETRRKRA
ncbi:MAG: hypothetical protein DMG22_22475 [Acidobacteria bacterium]|nr:MAG: hypothetical protein DMG22_22475 [Acidobacteriota bacterium]